MKQLFNSTQREEVAQVKRIMEEYLLPCLLVTDGEGLWKLFLNVATYAEDYPGRVAQAERVLESYGYQRKAS